MSPTAETVQDDYVGLLAHELRTPLTAIQGFAGTLLRSIDEMDRETIIASAEYIESNAKALAELIESLGDAHSIAMGNLSLDRQDVDAGAIVRDTVSALSCLLHPHAISVSVAGSGVADADPVRVRQIVTNLLSNAAKFSPGEAPIDVLVRDVPGGVEIVVEDRGPGVPSDREVELFTRFSRLGSEVKGWGLGLFISRGIATAHGGDLRYDPRDGGGSRFVLSLPRSR